MKDKIHSFVKKNFMGFVIGLLSTLIIGVASATTLFNSTDLSYSPPSGINVGNVTTVQQALDVLYNLKPDTYYYAYGNPTASSPTDYTTILNQGHRVFLRILSEKVGTNNRELCLVKNGVLACFKSNDFASQKYYVQAFFAGGTCQNNNDVISCWFNDGDTCNCEISSGGIGCTGNSDSTDKIVLFSNNNYAYY